MKKVLLLGLVLLAGACQTEDEKPKPKFVSAVEQRSGQVLYAPPTFALSTTRSNGAVGFRAEDVKREALFSVIETTADRLEISIGKSPEDFTSPVNGFDGLDKLVQDVRDNITILLPLSSPNEAKGDWSIKTLQTGTTLDIYGNTVVYGRYALQYKPIYALRSSQVYRFLAGVLLHRDWKDFPADDDKYFAAGKNAVQFAIALSLHAESGFYTGDQPDYRVGVAFAAAPDNSVSDETWNVLNDLVLFKTLGHVRDEVVADERVVDVPARGLPVDVIVAVDRSPSMRKEVATVRDFTTTLAGLLAEDTGFDYHIAFVTQGSSDFVRLRDGTRYLAPESKGLDTLADGVVDTIFADVENLQPVDPNLLQTAGLAITAPAKTGVNKAFFRPEAAKLLLVVTDRDDRSNAVDGTLISDPNTFIASYDRTFAGYTRFVVAPQQPCGGETVDATEAAIYLGTWIATEGGTFFDLCGLSASALADEVYAWGEARGSRFQFSPPLLFPFTLQVRLNGKRLTADAPDGFRYDDLGDRIEFRPVVTPKEGDRVEVGYYRWDVR